MRKYVILRDNNEKEGWHFQPSEECEGQIIKSLNTGDYSLKELEDKFVIERKGNIGEFAANIVQSRFEKELERMESFEHAYLILEFDLNDVIMFPKTSNIPQYRWPMLKINPNFIMSKLAYYSIKYKTKIIFAGQHGKRIAIELMRKVWVNYLS